MEHTKILTKKELALKVRNEFLERIVRIDIDIFSDQASIIVLPHEKQKDIVKITQEINAMKEAKKMLENKIRQIDVIISDYEKQEKPVIK